MQMCGRRTVQWLGWSLILACSGCGAVDAVVEKAIDDGADETSPSGEAPQGFAAFVSEAEPAERPYLEASQPFITALASRDYAKAYDQLSSHARASISPDQFLVPEKDNAPMPAPLQNVTAATFAEWMGKVEQRYGEPATLDNIYVQSIDPAVLAGTGDRMEVMFSIGAMPASIPTEIRKASLRGAVRSKLTDQQLQELAKEYGTTVEEIRADSEYAPYYNIKFVLVDEGGTLKVGYFEIMPRSILD